jgi:dienelactone hydrolase
VQQPPEPRPLSARPLELRDGSGNPLTQLDQWLARRAELRKLWLEFLGPLAARPRALPAVDLLEQEMVAAVVRQRLRYETEPGEFVEAYLLKPADARGPLPGVAVFHSTVNHSLRQPAGVEGDPEKAFGLKLAQRGCVAICPRNFLWPENDRIAAQEETRRFAARNPGSRGMARMLFDAQLAIDLLAAQPEVDASRLGAVGHSLGAKEVLYLAAFDERVRVTVSSEGGIGIGFSNWNAPWYLGPEASRPDFPRGHHELLALAAPRAFLLVGGDSADGRQSWPYIEAALPIYRLFPQSPPRLGLLRHDQGHSVPPIAEARIYEWCDALL